MPRVIVHYKPSRPTRTLELGKHPTTGKAWRRIVTANSTVILDQVEADAIKAAAKAAGIVVDFAFQVLQDAAEAATGLDLPEVSVKDPIAKAVGKLLDPDGDGKLGRMGPKAKARAKAKAEAEAAKAAPAPAPEAG